MSATTPPPAAPLPLVERVARIAQDKMAEHLKIEADSAEAFPDAEFYEIVGTGPASYAIARAILALVEPEIREECKRDAFNARFGPPSSWGGDRPEGWHLDRPCDPHEASMHDNGCVDAALALIRARKP